MVATSWGNTATATAASYYYSIDGNKAARDS
jgi:hypothetical protein